MENLNANYPIIYSGDNGAEGHAFVVDGYDSNGLFHINWGWNGESNGYFALDATEYSQNAGMVIGINPNRTETKYSKCFVDRGYFWMYGNVNSGPHISVENVAKGVPFSVNFHTVNYPSEFDGDFAVALVSKDDEIKEIFSTVHFKGDGGTGIGFNGEDPTFFNCIINSDIDASDRIQLLSKDFSDADWLFVYGTLECPSYLPVQGNTPVFYKVNWKYDEANVRCDYQDPITGQRNIDVPNSGFSLSVLEGSCIDVYFYNKNQDGIIVINLKGLYLGDRQLTEENGTGYALRIDNPEYNLEVKYKQYKDGETINVPTAGTLREILNPDSEEFAYRELKLTGEMDARDFGFLRTNYNFIKNLDLSELKIKECSLEGSGYYGWISAEQPENQLPDFAFEGMYHLTNIKLPNGILGIGNLAINATQITEIEIPSAVTFIGDYAFDNNNLLKTVVCKIPTPIEIKDDTFRYTMCQSEGALYVPDGSVDAYKAAPVWKEFAEIKPISSYSGIQDVTDIANGSKLVVFNTQGVKVYEGDKDSMAALAPGIYIVRQGNKTVKILVK